jgi:hypothetical protein
LCDFSVSGVGWGWSTVVRLMVGKLRAPVRAALGPMVEYDPLAPFRGV